MRMLWIYNVNASRAQMMGEKWWVFREMCGMTLKNTMWTKLGVWEWRNAHLTTQRAESKWVQEASATDFTNVGDSFDSSFRLRPLIQEQNSGTVYHIGLNPTDVQNLLYLRNSHHIMVRRPPYLKFTTKTGWEKQAQCRRKRDSKKGFENWGKQKNLVDLDHLVVFVSGRPAVEAKCISTAVQAEHVAFTPGCVAVGSADGEERRGQQLL